MEAEQSTRVDKHKSDLINMVNKMKERGIFNEDAKKVYIEDINKSNSFESLSNIRKELFGIQKDHIKKLTSGNAVDDAGEAPVDDAVDEGGRRRRHRRKSKKKSRKSRKSKKKSRKVRRKSRKARKSRKTKRRRRRRRRR